MTLDAPGSDSAALEVELLHALHTHPAAGMIWFWSQKFGLTDAALKAEIHKAFRMPGQKPLPHYRRGHRVCADRWPVFEFGAGNSYRRLAGQELLEAVRKALGIPYPKEGGWHGKKNGNEGKAPGGAPEARPDSGGKPHRPPVRVPGKRRKARVRTAGRRKKTPDKTRSNDGGFTGVLWHPYKDP